MLLHDTPISKIVPAIMLQPSLAAEFTVNLVFSCPDPVGGQSTPFDAALAFGPHRSLPRRSSGGLKAVSFRRFIFKNAARFFAQTSNTVLFCFGIYSYLQLTGWFW